MGNVLDNVDLEKILLKLCGNLLELEWIDALGIFCVQKLQDRIGY